MRYGIGIGELQDHGNSDLDQIVELLVSNVDRACRGVGRASLIWSHVKTIDQADDIATPSYFGRGAITRVLDRGEGCDERRNGGKGGCEGRRGV